MLRIFKNNGTDAADVGTLITVTRPGGSLIENGISYVARDRTFPDFYDGNIYILFLKPLSDSSHSFRVFPGDSFLISGSGLTRIDDYQRHSALGERLGSVRAADFAATLDAAVGNGTVQ